jgi:hypothetical protein
MHEYQEGTRARDASRAPGEYLFYYILLLYLYSFATSVLADDDDEWDPRRISGPWSFFLPLFSHNR